MGILREYIFRRDGGFYSFFRVHWNTTFPKSVKITRKNIRSLEININCRIFLRKNVHSAVMNWIIEDWIKFNYGGDVKNIRKDIKYLWVIFLSVKFSQSIWNVASFEIIFNKHIFSFETIQFLFQDVLHNKDIQLPFKFVFDNAGFLRKRKMKDKKATTKKFRRTIHAQT